MSGSSVTNKPLRPGSKCSSGHEESHAEQDLNGFEEGEDALTDEEGGVGGEGEGEGEAGAADSRVRAGPRNKPYGNRKRRTRSNAHAVPRLVLTLHDGQRSYSSPRVKKKKKEERTCRGVQE